MWTHLPHPPHRGFAHLYLSFHSMISLDRRGETDRIAIHHLPLFESIGCSNEDHNRHWIHIRKNSLITGKPNEFSSSLSLSSSLYHLSPLPRARSEPTLSIRSWAHRCISLFLSPPMSVRDAIINLCLLLVKKYIESWCLQSSSPVYTYIYTCAYPISPL
jgi:hypothetical protein